MKNFYDCATDRASRDAYRAALESLPLIRCLIGTEERIGLQ